ncbi:hypothetical protein D7V91_11180 [bacterium 1xD42-67]|nr:hypothetical protein D7V91_11180 [bacterium 1xD42-67]
MADSREMTFGLDFGLDESIDKLDDLINRLEQSIDSMGAAERAGRDMGADIEAGADVGAGGMDRLTDSIRGAADEAGGAADDIRRDLDDIGAGADETGDEFRDTFRRMGADAGGFGQAVAKSMGTALKEGRSAAKGLQAGFEGAIGYTQKKVGGLVTSFKSGAKNIGTAFMHPIKTIKDKLGAALLSAADDAEDLGDAADDARKDLDDMGDAGGDAGEQIKDAIKGALTAVIGLEAIKAGIDKLKELGAAALEAAGAAESMGKRFGASFEGTDAAEWVENFAGAVHRSTAEVQGFMVSNKAMYAELGITGEAATELSKITTSLAYDLGNAFSMDDAEALAVMQDYISGNTNALEEFGVHIDDATLKAKAMEMGLGAELDALDDAALAQVRMNTLLDQSSKIQQAAVKDTGGLVNSTKNLKGVWNEFLGDAGAKFSPMLEGLFGLIISNWPTIEPMLMQLVTVLSDGLAESMPVILELGQTLLPILIDVLGTLFQAATPLISVFSSLASTILPPVANIIGLLAETVIPPLVDILDTLNTSIITPLVPVIQRIAEALLPPIGQLLGAISPILQAISPVLSVIGDVLGTIADVLGSVVGWLADGVGAVANFFAGLFGGAKESEAAVNDLNGAVNGLDETTSKETSLAVDTNDYKEKVEGAANAATDAVTESSNAAKEITDVNFLAMGASATATYGTMQTDAETAWTAMTTAAETGAGKIVAALERITAAGKEAGKAASIQMGADIPHNARGTDNWKGGPTYMNEEGGELAVLPGGSAIIPADQTDRLMSSFSSNVTNQQNSRSMTFSPKLEIKVEGGGDPQAIADAVEGRIRALFDELYAEAQERDYTDRAMQQGYA